MDTNRNEKGRLADGPDPSAGGSTVAQLKNDIDMGRTGDRARTGDPGLSMLGTDDEAGGHPNSPELVDQMRKLEQGRSNAATDSKQAPGAHDQNQKSLPVGLILTAMVAIALALVWVFLLRAG
jgi:hypothetical protein